MAQLEIKTPTVNNSIIVKKKVIAPKIASIKLNNLVNQAYGTGRRKNAIARVWVRQGTGMVIINKKPIEQYFTREAHRKSLLAPFISTDCSGQYDIICTVKGGGCTGQAGAILHGTARALDKLVPDFHTILRREGFLTRDSRVVERKKYGKHKARKSTQFSKR